MKRFFLFLSLTLVLGLAPAPGQQHAHEHALAVQPTETVVYVTRTGERYHRGTCRYLKKSKIPAELGVAKAQGYTPCKVCKPPTSAL